MDRTPKYSVIIPIYNSEKTLRRCVDSLLNQNYSDAEIILVNDGSTDQSDEICKAYEAHSAVTYIAKPNGGVSSARNMGLEKAKGKYILFVDSDDYVADTYFLTLDKLCLDFDYDCVFFSFNMSEENQCFPVALKSCCLQAVGESAKWFGESLYRKVLNPPWNKRYKREIIEDANIRFSESLSIGEDKLFCLQYILLCRNCCISSELLYNVTTDNKNSLSRKKRDDLSQQFRLLDSLVDKAIQEADIPEENRRQLIAANNLIKIRSVYSEAKRMHLTGYKMQFRREVIKNMCKDVNKAYAELPDTVFSKVLCLPVKLKIVAIIDAVGKYLAK